MACVSGVFAQRSKTYTTADKLYHDGKEMFDQGIYSSAFRYFDEYFQTLDKDRSPLYAETEYHLCAAAYKMKRKDAYGRLMRFVENNPTSTRLPRVNFMLASINFERGRYKEAVELFANTNPSDLSADEKSDYYFRLGYCQLQCGNKDEARKNFETLLLKPCQYSSSAKYYKAYLDYQDKNFEEALPAFESLKGIPSYDSIVPYYITQIYYAQHKNEEVIKNGEELLSKYPNSKNNEEVYRLMGECYFQKKDNKNTIKYLSKYAKTAMPVLRNDMYMLGISYFKEGDCDKSIDYLQKVTATTDDLMAQNAYLHLGSCYLKKGDKNAARMAFEAASRAEYDKNIQEEALYNYALIVYEQSYSPFNESIVAFQKFLDLFPKSKYADSVYDYLVNVYLTTKNYDEALTSIEKIKYKNAKLLEARQRLRYCMGIQKFTDGEYAEAIDYFTSSLEDGKYNHTTEASAIFWRGEAYYKTSEFDKAAADYDKFLNSVGARNCDEFNLAHYNLGYSKFTEKKYTEALSWFRKYVNLEEKNKTLIADANNRIGDCYFYNRKLEEAEASYATVVSLKGPGADYACFQEGFVKGLRKNYKGKISTLNKLIREYPNSEYIADAMYEIGRSHIMLSDNKSAIKIYDEMMKKYPHSPLTRKAQLQTAMLYDEMNNYNKSVDIYKNIVELYPQSPEARTSLESLKTIYFEKDDVQGYADYVSTLGGIAKFDKNEQDSLTYFSAERLYAMENYDKASQSFKRYIEKYPNSRYSALAHYNLADCYYHLKKMDEAEAEYEKVASLSGHTHTEDALAKLSEIQYEQKDYAKAISSMERLLSVAQNINNKQAAKIGLMRSYAMVDSSAKAVAVASELISGDNLDPTIKREALYTRAKIYEKTDDAKSAFADYKSLSSNCADKYGAEAKYLVAQYLFNDKEDKEAEKEVFDFIEKNTPHQYWLAKSFILLSDIYIKQDNDFEAKQYLISLKENYKGNDDIATEIQARLADITEREKKKVVNK